MKEDPRQHLRKLLLEAPSSTEALFNVFHYLKSKSSPKCPMAIWPSGWIKDHEAISPTFVNGKRKISRKWADPLSQALGLEPAPPRSILEPLFT